MHRPTVFIPHLPTRNDPVTGSYVPAINTQPAARLGYIQVINDRPGNAYEPDLPHAMTAIQDAITSDMQDGDYIAIMGDAFLCAWAIKCAADLDLPVFNVLRWNRENRDYDLIKITPQETA